ncbi:phage repressor protein [Halorubrum sp. E3]|nr:phage repressor protein [Halorubrum sp. E3]OYR85347.1 phage repressor protein [Halorubrum distributum]
MVERVSWFSPVDYEILEFFENHDIVVSPKVLAANIDYNRQYVSKRCQTLLRSGLLDQPKDGLYQLSKLGQDFLAGNVDVGVIENAEE